MKATDFQSQGYSPAEAVDALVELRPSDNCYFHKMRDLVWNSSQPKPTSQQMIQKMDEIRARRKKDEYKAKRLAEYPDFREYLDGIVKNDAAQIKAYIDACLAVKAKYPKGQ